MGNRFVSANVGVQSSVLGAKEFFGGNGVPPSEPLSTTPVKTLGRSRLWDVLLQLRGGTVVGAEINDSQDLLT